MSNQPASNNQTYEIRLITAFGKNLLFATQATNSQEAVQYAKGLMLRHECDSGEVWCGMQLIRRL